MNPRIHVIPQILQMSAKSSQLDLNQELFSVEGNHSRLSPH